MKFLDRFKRKQPAQEQEEAKAKAKPPEQVPAYKPELKTAPAQAVKKNPPSDNELRLELGDFLHRIPAHLLLPGPHDLKAELRFDIADLSARINRGQTTVPLAEIYKRMPGIFRGEILESDNIEVRFPWQKLARLVNVNKAGATSGANAEAALTEKLRSTKKTARNIATGDNGGAPPKPEPPKETKPILPGRGASGRHASWFSKTGEPAAAPAPAPGPAPAPVPTQASAPAPEPLPFTLADAPEEPLPPSTPTPAPDAEKEPQLPFKLATPEATKTPEPPKVEATPVAVSTPEPVRPTSDDLRINDLPLDVQRRFAIIRGDYERQISELGAKNRSIIEARDRASAELEKLRKDLDHRENLLAREQTANAMGHDVIQRHQKEREEMTNEIAQLRKELESAISQTPNDGEPSGDIAALTAERDALLQQKSFLSAQLAELVNRRGPQAPQPAAGNALVQRQVEDLQRRIVVFEAAQKDAAVELQREKEARAKAEKLLSTADRLQEESALHMESTKAELRKEVEAQVRKAQKDLEAQVQTLTAERDDALRQGGQPADIVALSTQLSSLTEQHNATLAELETLRNQPAPAPQPAGIEAAAIQQLEADIENYRDRLKTLIRERDEARAAATAAPVPDPADLAAAREEAAAARTELEKLKSAADEIAILKRENDRVRFELEAALKNLSARETELKNAQFDKGESPALLQRITERDTRIAELEKARGHANDLAAAAVSDSRQQLDEITRQLEAERATHKSELRKITAERDARLLEMEATLSAQNPAPAQEDGKLPALQQALDAAHARLRETEELLAAERSAREANTDADKRHREHSLALEQQIAQLVHERDQFKAEVESLASELQAEAAAHEDLLTTIDKDHTSVVQAKEDLIRRLAEAEQAAKQLEEFRQGPPPENPAQSAEVQRLRAELDAANVRLAEISVKDAEFARLVGELEAARNRPIETPEKDAEIARLRAEISEARRTSEEAQQTLTTRTATLHENEAALGRLTGEHQTASAQLAELQHAHRVAEAGYQEKLAAANFGNDQLAARVRELEEALAALRAERDRLATELDEARRTGTHNTGTLTQLQAERDALASELSASRKQHQHLIGSLDNERGQLVITREAAEKRAATAEQQIATLEAAARDAAEKLEKERNLHVMDVDGLNKQFHAQAAEIEKRHAAELAKLNGESEETRRLLSDLRSASEQERDTLAAARTALEQRLAEMEAAHRAELAASEKERTSLQSTLKEVADYERTIAVLRSEREQAAAALASAERVHATALAEAEQRYRDGISAPTREVEQLRLAADTTRAELLVARKMHGEVIAGIERERAQYAATKADLEKKLESVDDARRQIAARFDDREQALRLLEEKLGHADRHHDRQRAEIADIRKLLETAQRETADARAAAANAETSLRGEIAQLSSKIAALENDRRELLGRVAATEDERRRALEAAAGDARNLSTERDRVAAELDAERRKRDTEVAAALSRHEEALGKAANEISRLEGELARARDQRDQFKREKDELARRVGQITEHQKRMLDDIAAGIAPGSAVRSVPPPVETPELIQPDGGDGVNLQRVRPVQVRPPQVRVL